MAYVLWQLRLCNKLYELGHAVSGSKCIKAMTSSIKIEKGP